MREQWIPGHLDPRFSWTCSALDARMKKLLKKGVGLNRNKASPIKLTQEQEKLWSLALNSMLYHSLTPLHLVGRCGTGFASYPAFFRLQEVGTDGYEASTG